MPGPCNLRGPGRNGRCALPFRLDVCDRSWNECWRWPRDCLSSRRRRRACQQPSRVQARYASRHCQPGRQRAGANRPAPFDGPNAGNASARPSGAAGSPLRSDLKKSSPSSSGSSKASCRQSSMSGETLGTARVTGPSARGGPPVPRPELPPTVSEEKRLRGIGIVLSGRDCKLRANPHDIRGGALKQGGSRSATLVFG